MGQWARRRLRSSGSSPAAGPPPSLLTAVDNGGGVMTLTFDGPITVDPFVTPSGGSLFLDGSPDDCNSATQSGANGVVITQNSDPSAGMTLTWPSQPDWIVTPIDLSTSVPVT